MNRGNQGQWGGDTYVRIPFEHGWSGSNHDVPPGKWRRLDAVPSCNWGGHDVPGREPHRDPDAPLSASNWGGRDIPGRPH